LQRVLRKGASQNCCNKLSDAEESLGSNNIGPTVIFTNATRSHIPVLCPPIKPELPISETPLRQQQHYSLAFGLVHLFFRAHHSYAPKETFHILMNVIS
jgi:hypothetical protein